MIFRISGGRSGRAAALVLIISLLIGSATRGIDKTWNDGTADWTVAGDWTPSDVPTSADNAIFRSGSGVASTVTFPGSGTGGGAPAVNYATDQLRVGNNSVTFADLVVMGSLVPSTYAANNATTAEAGRGIIVGELSTDTAAVLTTQLATFSGVAATIGDASSSSGTLNVSAGTFNVTGSSSTDFELIVGRNGAGTMNVSAGATANVSSALGDSVLAENVGSTGTVSVSGAVSNWTTTRNLLVGSSGNGTLSVTSAGQVNSYKSWVANNSTSTSTVTISGSGSKWTNNDDLYVGNSGGATINVLSGGQLSCRSGYLGNNAGSSGTATVNGTGSKWTNSFDLYVGFSGGGTLNVSGGASVTNSSSFIASETGSTGTVSLGPAATWTNAADVYVGNSGLGNLNITDGSQVTCRNGSLGYLAGSSGTATVSSVAATSQWNLTGNLSVGGSGSGLLTVGSGGTVSVGAGGLTIGSLGTVKGVGTISGMVQNGGTVAPGMSAGILNISGSYSQTAAGKLQIEIGGTTAGSSGYDRLAASGAMTLGGTLQVSLVNSFMPALGNRFDIMDWGSRTGSFSSKTLQMLPGTLGWGTSALYSAGVLSVIDTNYLPGDFNRDTQVSVADLAAMEAALKNLSAYQMNPAPPNGSLNSAQLVSIGDLTGDGLVNNLDLQGLIVYLANGGASAATAVAAVPEPRSILLVFCALGWMALFNLGTRGESKAPLRP